MTERLHFHFSLSCIGEGNGNPLQCSCLENPSDGGAWWVAQSRTRLKRLSSSSSSNRDCMGPFKLLTLTVGLQLESQLIPVFYKFLFIHILSLSHTHSSCVYFYLEAKESTCILKQCVLRDLSSVTIEMLL